MAEAFLTVPQVAEQLEMTADGVHKLIRRGKLKAVKRSERKTLVSWLALRAYQRRLNGETVDIVPVPPAPLYVPQQELRSNPGAVLARVEAGEELTITVRGRPVADLVPTRRGERRVVVGSSLRPV